MTPSDTKNRHVCLYVSVTLYIPIVYSENGIISLKGSGRQWVILERLETVVDAKFHILDLEKLLEVD